MLLGSLILLIALILLGVLIFPLRLRVNYRRSEDGDHQIVVKLRFRSRAYSGWEIAVFNFSSANERSHEAEKDGGPDQSKENADARSEQEDSHVGKSPLHTILNSLNIFQTLFEDGDASRGDDERSMLQLILHRTETPMRFLQYARDCEAWSWETRLGTGDAALTAILTGILWGVKASSYSVLSHWVNFREQPYFAVVPDYNRASFAVVFDGIFRFRLGQIILVETLAMLRKWKKGVGRFGSRQGTSY